MYVGDCDGLCMEEIMMGCEFCRDCDGLCVVEIVMDCVCCTGDGCVH